MDYTTLFKPLLTLVSDRPVLICPSFCHKNTVRFVVTRTVFFRTKVPIRSQQTF